MKPGATATAAAPTSGRSSPIEIRPPTADSPADPPHPGGAASGEGRPANPRFRSHSMTRRLLTAAVVLLALGGHASAQARLTVKTEDTPPPGDLNKPISDLLDAKALTVYDGGKPLCTVWLRKALDSQAGAEQVKKGLTYRDLEETTVVGAVRFPQEWTDFRKQKIRPGVYTLRLGFQPMDGDHMGTAPFNEFCLMVPAKLDEKPDFIDPKELRELSSKAIGGSHPGVLLLFPNEKPENSPKLLDKGSNTWALAWKMPISVDGKKAEGALGLALTLIGHTTAE